MNADLGAMCTAAVSIGFVHTLLGPDHYVPFVAMSRVGSWSIRKTLLITLLCGLAHVGSSVLLGFIGLALGLIVFQLEMIEEQRGNLAGWMLIAFGVAYSAWGLVRALRNRPHTHAHAHPNGTIHTHEHVHFDEHLHPHDRRSRHNDTVAAGDAAENPYLSPAEPVGADAAALRSMTPWILFAIFAFGPCEPLIPLLMYPAARADLLSAACVTGLFALTTLATMTTMVLAICAGAGTLRFAKLEPYSHALAGVVILSCGLAVKMGL
jgi:nickel/cobalt transporter (NicO) family protein